MPAVVRALQALAESQRPQFGIISGDITQRARRSQFAAARRFVDSLGVAWLAVPGNHDIPLYNLLARLFRPYGGYLHAFRDCAPLLDVTPLLAIGVNTTRWWRHKHGELSASQVAAVAQRLDNAQPAQLRVVVVHQPMAVLDPADEHDCLRVRGGTRESALATWAAAGADLILCGHIHRAYLLPLAGSRTLWCAQAGTAVSRRVRGSQPNSVNLIDWDGRECTVARWDYRAEVQAFALVERRGFQPARR